MTQDRICVVIPTYKEPNHKELAKQLGNVLHKDDKILFVDDSENLMSIFRLKGYNAKIGFLPKLSRKRGYGSSLKHGLVTAVTMLDADYVVQMDADHNPRSILALLRKRKRHDLVIGCEPNEHIISKCSRWVCHHYLGLKGFKHPTSGFRLWSNYAIRSLNWSKVKAKGFAVQAETLLLAVKEGLRIGEVDLPKHERREGKTKCGLKQLLSGLLTVARLKRKKSIGLMLLAVVGFFAFLGILGLMIA